MLPIWELGWLKTSLDGRGDRLTLATLDQDCKYKYCAFQIQNGDITGLGEGWCACIYYYKLLSSSEKLWIIFFYGFPPFF